MPLAPMEIFTNNPSTTTTSTYGTTSPAGGTVETWTVTSSASFPAAKLNSTQFHVADPALPSEIITVANVSGATWTVVRGAEGTTPVAHATGATFVQVVTAGALQGAQFNPWQFPVQAYGAIGDGQLIADATIAGGALTTLTSASALFTPADTGKTIMVNGALGATSGPLVSLITYVSATAVTLTTTATTAVAGTCAVWATDDTAAINAAVTAAKNYALANNYYAEVIFGARIFGLWAAPTQTTSPVIYNTQILVPYPDLLGASRKLVISFIGAGQNSQCQYWDAKIPNMPGTCLVSSATAPSTPSGTYYQQSVIGGPSQGGAFTGGFANVKPVMSGISVWCGAYTNLTAFDFTFCAAAFISDGSAHILTTPLTGVQPLMGTMATQGGFMSGIGTGLRMPAIGNNDDCVVITFCCEGYAYGMRVGDVFDACRIVCFYTFIGLYMDLHVGLSAISSRISIKNYSCGQSAAAIEVYGNGFTPVTISMTTEGIGTWHVSDTGNSMAGVIWWDDSGSQPMTPLITGAGGLNFVNNTIGAGVWASPPAAPASTVAQQNTIYRDATIYAKSTTSITNTAVGPTSGALTALGQTSGGGTAAVPIRVPSGDWYSVTYTGTLSTVWVLE